MSDEEYHDERVPTAEELAELRREARKHHRAFEAFIRRFNAASPEEQCRLSGFGDRSGRTRQYDA